MLFSVETSRPTSTLLTSKKEFSAQELSSSPCFLARRGLRFLSDEWTPKLLLTIRAHSYLLLGGELVSMIEWNRSHKKSSDIIIPAATVDDMVRGILEVAIFIDGSG